MNGTKNIPTKEDIDKLKSLVSDTDVCLFCSNLKINDGENCSPMAAQKVCDQGNLWFLSTINSDRNKDIEKNKSVQLFFLHPHQSSFLIVNGEAEIISDKHTVEALGKSMVKKESPQAKKDLNNSIIKVNPTTAFYSDAKENQIINFLQIIASAADGKNTVTRKDVFLNIKEIKSFYQ